MCSVCNEESIKSCHWFVNGELINKEYCSSHGYEDNKEVE